MTTTVQIVALALTLIFLGSIIRLVRTGRLRAKYSFLWLMVGSWILLLAAVPPLLERLSKAAGIYYSPAFVFASAIMLLLFIAVHFSWELSRLEDRTRTLVEEIALANQRIEQLESEAPADSPMLPTRDRAGAAVR